MEFRECLQSEWTFGNYIKTSFGDELQNDMVGKRPERISSQFDRNTVIRFNQDKLVLIMEFKIALNPQWDAFNQSCCLD